MSFYFNIKLKSNYRYLNIIYHFIICIILFFMIIYIFYSLKHHNYEEIKILDDIDDLIKSNYIILYVF